MNWSEKEDRWLRWGWPLAVAIHLPIPLFFGWTTSGEGLPRLGMFFGIALVYFVGRRLIPSRRWFMRRLTIGAFITSISQIWPVGQMMIGVVAILISKTIFSDAVFGVIRTGGNWRELENLPAVMSATVLTGLGLILPSFLVGFVTVFLMDSNRSRRSVR
ncbi:MAG: hypothetical protein ACK58L_15330 [Planctomycetota bacterium]